jgi:hypothetical protein
MTSRRDALDIDRQTVESLLSTRALPTNGPAPYERVALLLAAAAALPDDVEMTPGEGVSRQLAAAARNGKRRRWFRRARPSLGLSFRSKMAALGMTLFLTLSGSLAAAGALPDGAQRVVHNVLNTVGIHVPNSHAGNHPFERGKSGKPKTHVPGQNGKSSQNPHFQPSPTQTGGAK